MQTPLVQTLGADLSGADWRLLRAWRNRARGLRQEVVAIALAMRDPRVPWYAKAVAACVVAYALSPIDLIPDFIPVFGLLDDLVLVPLGIMLVVRIIPADIVAEHRAAAASVTGLPASRAAAVAVVAVWVVTAAAVTALILRGFGVTTIIAPRGGSAPP